MRMSEAKIGVFKINDIQIVNSLGDIGFECLENDVKLRQVFDLIFEDTVLILSVS